MTESLNYIIKKIDWDYLTSNAESLKDGNFTCPKDEKLPCNCIPGVVINYSAFLATLFLEDGSYEPKLEISGNNGYIRCCRGPVKLFPIEDREKADRPYVLEDLICQKSEGESAYTPFPPYSELPAIKEYLGGEVENPTRYPADSVRLELLIRLLSAMRARPLCQSSKAFLFMATYLSPKRTLRLMYEAREEIEREWLGQFMLAYVKFLQNIADDNPIGFTQRLNGSFREAVGFDIAAFLEKIEPAGKIYEKMLISSYKINLSDLSRKRTPIRRICEYISDEQIDAITALLISKYSGLS